MLLEGAQDPHLFFVSRVRDQARQEGFSFTPFEDEYLTFTSQGNDEAALQLLKTVKGKAFDEFDRRISGLAWRAYQQDLLNYSGTKERYDIAMRALANADRNPNLAMFVNCIALETPPEKLNARRVPWLFVIFCLMFLFFVLKSMWHSYFGL